MKTSTTKLIAVMATAAGLLMTNSTFAKGKGGGGGGGGGGGMSRSMSMSNFSNRTSSMKLSSGSNFNTLNKSSSLKLNFGGSNNFSSLSKNSQKLTLGGSNKFNQLMKHNDNKFNSTKFNLLSKHNDNKFNLFSKHNDSKFNIGKISQLSKFNGKDKKHDFDFFFGKHHHKHNWWWWNYYYYPRYTYYPGYWNYCYPIYNYNTYGFTSGPIAQSPTLTTATDTASLANTTQPAEALTDPALTTPVANTTEPAATEPRTKIEAGSSLLVEGQTFGPQKGTAKLRVGTLSMDVEVLEWSNSSVQIRLPKLETQGATIADIDVMRADGSLASKTPIELIAASESVALNK